MKFSLPEFNCVIRLVFVADWQFFNRISKLIWDWFRFASPRSVIGPENSHHHLDQSNAKLKPISTWSPSFSRASSKFPVFTPSSHWLMMTLTFLLIVSCCFETQLKTAVLVTRSFDLSIRLGDFP